MKYKKSLGQHILNDKSIAQYMVDSAEVDAEDVILEIGPGTGILTKQLLSIAGTVAAVELDRRMIPILCEKFASQIKNLESPEGRSPSGRLRVIEKDILRFLNEGDDKLFKEPFKVVASLPYNVGTAIIRKLMEGESQPEVVVVLLQLEVVKRICSSDGNGTILSNAVQYYAEPEMLMEVSPEKFNPLPKVTSAVLRIKNIQKRDPEEAKKFFRLIKIGFSSKRRTLVNNLSGGFPNMTKEGIEEILEKVELSKMVRAEDLRVEDWMELIPFFK